jgi:hypothetical protein
MKTLPEIMESKFLIETEVADALLDVGISAPMKAFRLPFGKKPIVLRVTVRRPTAGSMIRISKLYLAMGVSLEEYRTYGMDERIRFNVEHGKRLSRILALGVCRGLVSGVLFSGIVSWFLHWMVEAIYREALFEKFITLLGTQSFEAIITLLEENNLLSPMNVSPKRKGS